MGESGEHQQGASSALSFCHMGPAFASGKCLHDFESHLSHWIPHVAFLISSGDVCTFVRCCYCKIMGAIVRRGTLGNTRPYIPESASDSQWFRDSSGSQTQPWPLLAWLRHELIGDILWCSLFNFSENLFASDLEHNILRVYFFEGVHLKVQIHLPLTPQKTISHGRLIIHSKCSTCGHCFLYLCKCK